MTDNDTYTAHVIPQSVARGTAFVTCTLDDGRNFTCTLQNDVEWQAGGEYTYEISLIAAGAGYIYDDATHTYTVYNTNGLLAWSEAARNDLSLNCTLAADITLPEVTGADPSNWTPVGYYDYDSDVFIGYTGTFDGGGHTITGLTIDLPSQEYVGLFGVVGEEGTVKNLTLAGAKINGNWYVGGVAGFNFSGTLTACYWSNNLDAGIGDGSGDVTQVDGTTVTWVDAVGEMNSVLNSLTTWYYELVGDNLPVLMQRQ